MSVIKINYTKREIIYIKMLACSMFVFKLVWSGMSEVDEDDDGYDTEEPTGWFTSWKK
jgi:hypothetical protein